MRQSAVGQASAEIVAPHASCIQLCSSGWGGSTGCGASTVPLKPVPSLGATDLASALSGSIRSLRGGDASPGKGAVGDSDCCCCCCCCCCCSGSWLMMGLRGVSPLKIVANGVPSWNQTGKELQELNGRPMAAHS